LIEKSSWWAVQAQGSSVWVAIIENMTVSEGISKVSTFPCAIKGWCTLLALSKACLGKQGYKKNIKEYNKLIMKKYQITYQ
jgi:hypothetical protein